MNTLTMKSTRILTLFLILFLLGSLNSNGQFVVKKVAGNSANTSQDGFYYALPQTILKIDLLIEKIKKIPGPLADYAEDYLGVSDYIRYNSQSVQLINAEVTPLYEADPEQFYYVQYPAEKSKDEKAIAFQFTKQGTLLGYGDNVGLESETHVTEVDQTIIMLEGDENFSYYADYNRRKKIDTIVRKISIDTITIERFLFKTSWVDKSNNEKANEAAKKISEIRESRFHLISGYQEVNYGESIKYMNDQLKKLEKKYLELFLGKEVKTTEIQSVFYIPQKDKSRDIVYNDPDGNHIEINIMANNTTSQLPPDPLEKIDNIYYRIPQIVNVNIIQKGSTYFSSNIAISQFGIIATAPLNRTKLLFDDQTGNLINIVREQ